MMVIAMTMMTIGFVSCSASDDEMGETVSRVTTNESGFSLLSYSMTAGSAVSEESNSKAENDEKLVCKVLPGGQLMLTHKNVIFDQGTNIKFATQLVGKKLIITETGDYGKSGQYGYYTLVAKVGTVKDGSAGRLRLSLRTCWLLHGNGSRNFALMASCKVVVVLENNVN